MLWLWWPAHDNDIELCVLESDKMSKILQIRTFSSLRRFVITSEAIIIKPISIKVPVSCHQQIRLFSKSKIFKQQSAAEEQMIKILADSFPGATGAVFKIRTKYLSLKAAPFGGTPTLIPVILILSIWCFICIYIKWNLPTHILDWHFGPNRSFSNSKKPIFFQKITEIKKMT